VLADGLCSRLIFEVEAHDVRGVAAERHLHHRAQRLVPVVHCVRMRGEDAAPKGLEHLGPVAVGRRVGGRLVRESQERLEPADAVNVVPEDRLGCDV